MYILKKKLKSTCTAHYLGKDFPRACKNIHGHNYNYIIEVGGEKLNEYDMLIDFSYIKDVCDDWLQSHWDHTMLFSDFQLTDEIKKLWNKMNWKYEIFPVSGVNTTAEQMSEYLAKLFYNKLILLGNNISYITMHIWETEGSESQYTYKGE